jgi:DNA-binding LacI/PurR family transcriptional regulator
MKMQLLASQDQYTHTEASRDRHRGFRDALYQKGLSPSRTPYSVAS